MTAGKERFRTLEDKGLKTQKTPEEALTAEEKAKAEEEKNALYEKQEKRLEIVIAIFLGLTALLVAWAGWIGSIHSGNQNDNYTMSNNYASAGSSEYNAASQYILQDMMVWNTIQDYLFEKAIAEYDNDYQKAQMLQDKVDHQIRKNCSEEFAEAINWAYEQDPAGTVSPFTKPGMIDGYYTKANELLEESMTYHEQGEEDSSNSDKYGLVGVVYSLVLFLLGIVGIFKRLPNRRLVFWVSIGLLVIATVYMCMIPLPTGFSLANCFDF